jgi:hypothetical protein
MKASIPAVNRRKSISIPSEKMTPLSGMRGAKPQGRIPADVAVHQARLRRPAGEGLADREHELGAVPGLCDVAGDWPPATAAVMVAEPVTTLLSHAVEPIPVETISPDDDCSSLCPDG